MHCTGDCLKLKHMHKECTHGIGGTPLLRGMQVVSRQIEFSRIVSAHKQPGMNSVNTDGKRELFPPAGRGLDRPGHVR